MNTLHQPRCAVCASSITRLDPMKRDSAWTHGTQPMARIVMTAADRRLNRDHGARP